jgi:hypothetical protein
MIPEFLGMANLAKEDVLKNQEVGGETKSGSKQGQTAVCLTTN